MYWCVTVKIDDDETGFTKTQMMLIASLNNCYLPLADLHYAVKELYGDNAKFFLTCVSMISKEDYDVLCKEMPSVETEYSTVNDRTLSKKWGIE